MTEFHLWGLLAVLGAGAAHALLKLGSLSAGGDLRRVYGNRWTVLGYGLMVLANLMNLQAFRGLPLKAALLMQAMVLLLVAGVSVTLFHERLGRRQWLGAAIILLGVIVYEV